MKKIAAVSMMAGALLAGCWEKLPPGPPPPTPGPRVIVEGNGEPLIVDWEPQHRGNLELAMKDGLAVVEYSDRGFRLLKNCSVDGQYDFVGMSTKEQLVRLESADDIRANLPLGGAGLVGQLGGELGRSTTLDVAMVMIGKIRTTWNHVSKKDLHGECAGASHFVKGAMVGAFVMETGDKAHARAVAEFFSIGVGGGSARASKIHNSDGKLDDCKSALPDAAKAPARCAALLRVELIPITAEKPEAAVVAVAAEKPPPVHECPSGMVRMGGKCTTATHEEVAASATECTYGQAKLCAELCEKGSGVSCGRLGLQLLRGENIAKDLSVGAKATLQGCKLNDGPSCEYLGDFLASNEGGSRNMKDATVAWSRGCDLGQDRACTSGGATFYTGDGVPQDYAQASKLLDRGCKGGNHNACSTLGIMYLGNAGVGTDQKAAAKLFKQACDGDSAAGCANLGYMVEFGKSVVKNSSLAVRLYEKACSLDKQTCVSLAQVTHAGIGVTRSASDAIELFKTACSAGDPTSCSVLRAYGNKSGTVDEEAAKRNLQIWKGTCASGIERDCTAIGVAFTAFGKVSEGRRFIDRGCSMGDEWACALLKLKVMVPER